MTKNKAYEQDIRRSPDFGLYAVPWQRRLLDRLTPQALQPTWEVNGIDVSRWNMHMDWAVAASRGIKFAYIRAGYGESSVDAYLDANRLGCTDNAIEYGLYWFLHIGKSYATTAQSFYNAWRGAPGKLYAVADCEYAISGMNATSRFTWIKNFVTELEQKCARESMIYSSPGWWNANVARNAWAQNKKLWVAHWTTASAPIIPYDWSNYGKTWRFWQHSADNNGLGRYYGSLDGDLDMDLNRYNGSLADFYAEFQIQPPLTLEQRVTNLETEARAHGWNIP